MYELDGNLFDWDPNKELINIQKHGVTFKEAASAFLDENALEADDIDHSQEEDRFLINWKKSQITFTCCLPLL